MVDVRYANINATKNENTFYLIKHYNGNIKIKKVMLMM